MGDGSRTRDRVGGDRVARARTAARHAERLYPGPLGRLVALELTTYAETAPTGRAGPVDAVVAEVLDRTPRATG